MKGAKILKKGQQFESKGPFFKSVFFCTQITAEVFVCLFVCLRTLLLFISRNNVFFNVNCACVHIMKKTCSPRVFVLGRFPDFTLAVS